MPLIISPELTGSGFLFNSDINDLVARGMVEGAYRFGAYGERTSAGSETNFPVWPNGSMTLPADTGVQMTLVSTSTDDAAEGTGAQQVRLIYLDVNLNMQREVVTLNGTTSVTTDATDIRFIQCMYVHDAGTGAKAAGDISAANGGTTYSEILTGDLRCSSSFRMVPAGKRLFVMGGSIGSASSTADAITTIRIVASEIDEIQYKDPLMLFPFVSVGVANGSTSWRLEVPEVFQAGTLVGATHTTDKAATVGANWYGRIEGA